MTNERTSTTRIALALAALLTLTGCPSPGDGDGNNGSPAELTEDEFIAFIGYSNAMVVCRKVFECPWRVDGELFLGFARYPDQAACADRILELTKNGATGDLRAALASERTSFDGEAAAACKAALEASLDDFNACTDYEDIRPKACEDIVVGTVAVGENCADDQECADGGPCVRQGDVCYGTCAPANTCGGQECTDSEYCRDDDGLETCKPIVDVGDTCDVSSVCVDGASCLIDGDSDLGTCVEYASRAAGEPCSFLDKFCAVGLACTDGVCGSPRIEFGEAGEGCDFDNTICTPGVVCTDLSFSQEGGISGTCGTPQKAGEECYYFFECEAGLTCVGSSLDGDTPVAGTCGDLLAEGEACSRSFDCTSGMCFSGVCQAPSTRMSCDLP